MILDQAPNMFVDYFNYDGESVDHSDMDMIIVDWRCYTDSPGTYWAVHQFGSGNGIDGYAGFINNGTSHRVLFSLWNDGTNYSTVEYVSGLSQLNDLTFVEGDGSGKHIFTNYNWSPNTWYTMCIGVKNVAGKTYYAQWIRRETSTRWILCGVISFPVSNKVIKHDSMFQEDYGKNNNERISNLRNAFGKKYGESNWVPWEHYQISNNIYINGVLTDQNIRYDCHYSKEGSNYNEYIAIESGGDNSSSPIIHTDIHPPQSFSIFTYFIPDVSPSWANFVPRYIKNKTGNLYVAPGASNSLVLSTTPYYWYFVDSGDGFYYIKNADLTKAITATVLSVNGTVILSSFNQTNYQKWKTVSDELSEFIFISPKSLQSLDVSVNGTPALGSALVLKAHNSSSDNSMWLSLNTCSRKKIRNYYSNYYASTTLTDEVIQSSSAFHWNIIDAGNGYVYILSSDNTKAITITGINDGDNLIYSNYVPGNENQMWHLDEYSSDIYYIIPKLAPTKNIDIENNYSTSGSFLELKTHNDNTPRFRWIIE